ncbi:hypothetical protein [Pseudidiomarina sp.]|uniref:hypothetical protein n=1 Tax=Pseudidiomarina sp. TaxID=2081707 RepID=UPI00299D3063|nr:hypothetical protein [Pseudidiomarina sp.]MDX1705999.1 hypothetical protein [Pseudidiomarina sp.]
MKQLHSLTGIVTLGLLLTLSVTFAPVRPALAQPPLDTPEQLVFRAPEPSPLVNYVTAVLEEAYAELGIPLKYVEMPRQRSLVEANHGRIAGELGRLPGLEQTFSNLRRVDFPLFAFQLVLIADRRECGVCSLDDIENLAYIRGMQGIERLLEQQDYQRPVVQAVDLEQLFLLFDNKRVKAIILNNFEAQELGLRENRHLIEVPFQSDIAYHYLHKNYADLIPKLEVILHRMHDEGRVVELMREHHAASFIRRTFSQPPQFGQVSATAGYWRRYTNLNGTGAYWEIVKRIFGPVSDSLELNANTYQRAILGLTEQRFDILVGSYAGHQPSNAIVSEVHFDYDRPLYAFTLDDEAMAHVKAGTLARPVCHVAGYGYHEFLPKGLSYYHANNSLDCFAMLDKGTRIGAVVNYRENMPDWMDYPYKQWLLHGSLPIHMAFQDTPRGRRLKEWFDVRMRELVASGEIAEIYNTTELERSKFLLSIPPEVRDALQPNP